MKRLVSHINLNDSLGSGSTSETNLSKQHLNSSIKIIVLLRQFTVH